MPWSRNSPELQAPCRRSSSNRSAACRKLARALSGASRNRTPSRKLASARASSSASVADAAAKLILALEDARLRADERHPLVVIAQDGVLLRKGNGEAYPRRYDTPVNRGVEARLVEEREGFPATRGAVGLALGAPTGVVAEHQGWVQIELAGGEVGWVPRRFVLIDRPGD